MSSSLLRSNDYYLYLKKYPSLEDLKEENEDTDEFKIDELKNPRFKESRVMVRKKEFLNQSVPNNTVNNQHVYEKVNRQDTYVKKISYSSTFANKCLPLKGYVWIFKLNFLSFD